MISLVPGYRDRKMTPLGYEMNEMATSGTFIQGIFKEEEEEEESMTSLCGMDLDSFLGIKSI